MKKLFFATLLAALVVGVSSCKKGGEEDSPSLAGTSWMNDDSGFKQSFVFKTSSTGSYDVDAGIEVGFNESIPFTYTYAPPKVTITITVDGETGTQTGTIDGNKLTFPPDVDGEAAPVFTKQ
jgi:hypothetical protein